MNEIERLQESSQYLATLLRGHPNYRDWLLTEKNLHRRYPLTELYEDLQKAVSTVQTFAELLIAFREFKQRHFLRIGGRDLLEWADLTETTAQISDLASVTLQIGLEVLSRHPGWWLAEEEGAGWARLRENTQLVIIGLGKLGGYELNYVSDVDLLFLYAPKVGMGRAGPHRRRPRLSGRPSPAASW
jgi:[glutamine synthetase] adenylyltransferase / [glutamine synthetase]-adenylyl-L-tyrosine phosphorylase